MHRTAAPVALLLATCGAHAQCALAADIEPGPGSSQPDKIAAAFGRQLYFSARTSANGIELWRWTAAAGIALAADIAPGTGNSHPDHITPCCTAGGPRVFFSAGNLGNNVELWMTDPATGATSLVKEIRPGFDGSGPREMVASGGRVFFTANDGTSGDELWVSDGTAAGTQRVIDLEPGPSGANPAFTVALNGRIVFTAHTTATGRELYVSDGTVAGTSLLADLVPGIGSPNIIHLARCGDLVYFNATTNAGNELWKTDGTPAGTALVADLMPGPNSSNPSEFCTSDDLLHFAATVPGVGRELFVTDGTPAGTRIVKDLVPGISGGNPAQLVQSGDRVFFVAGSGANAELWVTDGSSAGTYRIEDLWPGSWGSLPRFLVAAGNGVCFQAQHPTLGAELFFSDGTPDAIALVCDIDPGGSGWPQDLVTCGGRLFFSATGPGVGVELYEVATPGALIAELGEGSLPDRPRLTLRDRTPPFLGSRVEFNASGPAGHIGVLMVGPSALPSPVVAGLFQGGCDHVGLLAGTAISVAGTPSSPFSLPVRIPAGVANLGVILNLQMVWADLTATPPLQLTNGLQLVMGRRAPQ